MDTELWKRLTLTADWVFNCFISRLMWCHCFSCQDYVRLNEVEFAWKEFQKPLKTLASKVSDLAEVHMQYHSKQVYSVLELGIKMRLTEI